jgi:hypothetical protein
MLTETISFRVRPHEGKKIRKALRKTPGVSLSFVARMAILEWVKRGGVLRIVTARKGVR